MKLLPLLLLLTVNTVFATNWRCLAKDDSQRIDMELFRTQMTDAYTAKSLLWKTRFDNKILFVTNEVSKSMTAIDDKANEVILSFEDTIIKDTMKIRFSLEEYEAFKDEEIFEATFWTVNERDFVYVLPKDFICKIEY